MAFYIKCISGKDTAGFTTTGFYLDSSGSNNKQSFSTEADARNAELAMMASAEAKQDAKDKDILIPIRDELVLFEKAKNYLKQYSYRDVANWLSEQSGRYISHVGLMKRVKLDQKRKKDAANQRYFAERYKEAIEKAEKLEKGRFNPVKRTAEESIPTGTA